MFVIFGASGNTGSVVASTLLDRGKKVRVVARDASRLAALAKRGAEVFAGDVLDGGSVKKALEGAEAAYMLIPPDPKSTSFVARSHAVIDDYAAALAGSGVRHVAFLSSVGAELASGTGPIATAHYGEEALANAGAKTVFTFVRAAYFMENILGYAHPMKADGVLPVFGGGESYPFPMVAARDIGRVAAEALMAPPGATQIIELSGPKEYSYTDAAAVAAKLLGKPVRATALPIEGIVPALTAAGMSDDVAKLYREMVEGFGKGAIHFHGTHRSVRGTTELAEVLRAIA